MVATDAQRNFAASTINYFNIDLKGGANDKIKQLILSIVRADSSFKCCKAKDIADFLNKNLRYHNDNPLIKDVYIAVIEWINKCNIIPGMREKINKIADAGYMNKVEKIERQMEKVDDYDEKVAVQIKEIDADKIAEEIMNFELKDLIEALKQKESFDSNKKNGYQSGIKAAKQELNTFETKNEKEEYIKGISKDLKNIEQTFLEDLEENKKIIKSDNPCEELAGRLHTIIIEKIGESGYKIERYESPMNNILKLVKVYENFSLGVGRDGHIILLEELGKYRKENVHLGESYFGLKEWQLYKVAGLVLGEEFIQRYMSYAKPTDLDYSAKFYDTMEEYYDEALLWSKETSLYIEGIKKENYGLKEEMCELYKKNYKEKEMKYNMLLEKNAKVITELEDQLGANLEEDFKYIDNIIQRESEVGEGYSQHNDL